MDSAPHSSKSLIPQQQALSPTGSSPRSETSNFSRSRSIVTKSFNTRVSQSRMLPRSRPQSRAQEYESSEANTLSVTRNHGHSVNMKMLEMEDSIMDLRKKIDSRNNTNQGIKETVTSMAVKLQEERRSVHDMQELNSKIERRKMKALEERLAVLQQKFDQSRSQYEKYVAMVRDNTSENKRLRETHDKVMEEVAELETECTRLKQRLQNTTTALHALHTELTGTCKQFETSKECWKAEIQVLQKLVDNDEKVKEHIYSRSLAIENRTNMMSPPTETCASFLNLARGGKKGFEFITQEAGHFASLSRLEVIERAFKRIQSMVKADGIDQAIQIFINTEDATDGLEDVNGKLTVENDKLRKDMEKLSKELFEFKTLGSQSQTAINKRLIDLESRYAQAELDRENLAAECAKLAKLAANARAGIYSLSRHCQVQNPNGATIDSNDMSTENILMMIEIIEDRLVGSYRNGMLHSAGAGSVSSFGGVSSGQLMRSSHLSLPQTAKERPNSPGFGNSKTGDPTPRQGSLSIPQSLIPDSGSMVIRKEQSSAILGPKPLSADKGKAAVGIPRPMPPPISVQASIGNNLVSHHTDTYENESVNTDTDQDDDIFMSREEAKAKSAKVGQPQPAQQPKKAASSKTAASKGGPIKRSTSSSDKQILS